MKRTRTTEYVKIFSRLSRRDYDRMSDIKEKYGFRSNYEILQYLALCFLRVADPARDPAPDPIPIEIEQMFAGLSEAEKHFDFVKPHRRCPHPTPDTV